MPLGLPATGIIIGTLLAVIATAAPYEFEATVRADVDANNTAIELPVDLGELRALLNAEVPEGQLHAEVTDLTSGRPMTTVMSCDAAGKGLIAWRIPGAMSAGDTRRFRVVLREGPGPTTAPRPGGIEIARDEQRIAVSTGAARITHDLTRGGMISRIDYGDPPGRTLDLSMNDRVYQQGEGGFYLRQDPEPTIRITDLPGISATVRVESRYMSGGRWPESRPAARYEFTYRAGSPFIQVAAEFNQERPKSWSQLHFLEMHHTQDFFSHWASAEPIASGELTHPAKTQSLRGKTWGALLNDQDALALTDTALYGIHDGLGKYGIYVHGPWLGGISGPTRLRGWVYVGPSGGSPGALAQLMAQPLRTYSLSVQFPEARERTEDLAARLTDLEQRRPNEAAADLGTRLKAARMLLAEAQDHAAAPGQLRDWGDAIDDAQALMSPADEGSAQARMMLFAGDMFLRLRQENGRVWISRMADLDSGTSIVAQSEPASLWAAGFRHHETGEMTEALPEMTAPDRQEVTVEINPEGAGMRIRWENWDLPDEPGALDVTVTARAEPDASLLCWRIAVANRSENWGLWEVEFPRLEGIQAGPESSLIVPRKWGTRYDAPASGRGFAGRYPSAWMNMQFFSFALDGCGLYLAAHDPDARIKQFAARPEGSDQISYALTGYPDDMGAPGRDYQMPFDAVVGVHPGGWYDAAKIYRAWATRAAPWCAGGPLATREDVPQWFKDCALCFRPGGAPERVLPALKTLHAAFQMPAVVHWYSWHQIPFDNDYPEYFPTQPGFAEAVAEAQELGLRIMPYINGRLWDSDTQSWAAEHADRAVVLNADGEPYWEHWQKQNHGVMCPFTQLWQSKMRDIASRLADECGCAGVYLDQIGAARGNLCFADNHGHGIGGAKSWVEGERKLLAGVREAARAVNPEFIMTTEDNAEPYMAQLDGYLMCNAVGPGMVPLFAAVYGGYTLTFGRSGQINDDVAFAMQHGEAFTFGSMMGRIFSDPITKPEHAQKLDFLKRLARMRYECREFLALGEMLRAPKLTGEIPILRGEFQSKFRGAMEMPALLSAAWRAPDGRLGLFFVNISKEPVDGIVLSFRGADYGIEGEVEVTELPDDAGPSAGITRPAEFSHELRVRPWHARAVIVRAL